VTVVLAVMVLLVVTALIVLDCLADVRSAYVKTPQEGQNRADH
jgi:hypothetical protein